jgi:transmembrane 9 superfamily member 3
VTIVAVYFLLNSEDYRWPWLSFLAAGSTAVYVFLYAVFFFFMKTGYVSFGARLLFIPSLGAPLTPVLC